MQSFPRLATLFALTTLIGFAPAVAQARGDTVSDRSTDDATPTTVAATPPAAPPIEPSIPVAPWDRHFELVAHTQLINGITADADGPTAIAMITVGYAPISALQFDIGAGMGLGGPQIAFDIRPRLVVSRHVAFSVYGGLSAGKYHSLINAGDCEDECTPEADVAGWFNFGASFEYRADFGLVVTTSLGASALLGTSGSTCNPSGGFGCTGSPDTPSALAVLDIGVGYAF